MKAVNAAGMGETRPAKRAFKVVHRMRRALRSRLGAHDGEAGLTLIEMFVAAAMSIVIVGAATAMLISAVQQQPELSKRAQNISTARCQLERLTREIRNGISVTAGKTTPSEVSFVARVRRASCGSADSVERKRIGDQLPGDLQLHGHLVHSD